MSIFLIAFLIFMGALFYLFFYWHRLKDDYDSFQIFTSSFIILLSLITFSLLAHFFLAPRLRPSALLAPQGIWFWGAVSGFFLAHLLCARRLRLKYLETFEANIFGLLFPLLFLFIGHALIRPSLIAYLSTGFIAISILFFLFLNSHYKKFTWYRSGRIGFAGLVTAGSLFLARAAVALHFPTMLSLSGRVEMVASAAVSFILFFAVYNLAELN